MATRHPPVVHLGRLQPAGLCTNGFYANENFKDQFEKTKAIFGAVDWKVGQVNWKSNLRGYKRQREDDFFSSGAASLFSQSPHFWGGWLSVEWPFKPLPRNRFFWFRMVLREHCNQ